MGIPKVSLGGFEYTYRPNVMPIEEFEKIMNSKPGEWVPVPEGTRPKDVDPSGKSLKEPGTKGDLGKSPVTRGALHYFPRALKAVAELSYFGARKYSWKGWESVPDGINRYSDAIGRHELAIEGDFRKIDPETQLLEATAVAWNALARLELIQREIEKEKAKHEPASVAVQSNNSGQRNTSMSPEGLAVCNGVYRGSGAQSGTSV